MDASHAKGVLSGIISLACRQLDVDPSRYRVKPGGGMLGKSQLDWYVTVQNVQSTTDISRNTKKAKVLSLIKTHFVVQRIKPDEPPMLRVLEWDASKDWGGDYRLIYEASADDMGARRHMADLLKAVIARSQVAAQQPPL
jgi:hypothetical protein